MSSPTTVFILANNQRELHIGYTKNVEFALHRAQTTGLDQRQLRKQIIHLVYIEKAESVLQADKRVKTIYRMSKTQRHQLIEEANPHWKPLREVKILVAAGQAVGSIVDRIADSMPRIVVDMIRRFKGKHPDGFGDDFGSGGVTAKLPVGPVPPVKTGSEAHALPIEDCVGVR